MAQTLRDVMTADPTTLPADATVLEAAKLMRDEDIGNIIVLDGDSLAGIVTDRDLVIRAIADGADPAIAKVGDVCSRDLATLAPTDDVKKALKLMRERAVRRLPVVDGGRPVGIVSIGDLAVETSQDTDKALADISAAPPDA